MSVEKMVEQQVREYLARLEHIDALYARASRAVEDLHDDHHSKLELDALAEKKAALEEKAKELGNLPVENWQKELLRRAGPMSVWDIVAQHLENFIERHE